MFDEHDAHRPTNSSADLLDFPATGSDNRGMQDEFTGALRSFRRHLKSQNRSDKTIQIYVSAAARFADWLRADSNLVGERPGSYAEADHHHLSDYFAHLLELGL